MVGSTGPMLRKELLDGLGLQKAAIDRPAVMPGLACEFTEFSPEPLCKRQLQPLFAFVERTLRKPWLYRLAQRIFSNAALELHALRHRERPVDELVGQERNARLQRVRHAGAIEAIQVGTRHVHSQVRKHELLQRIQPPLLRGIEIFVLQAGEGVGKLLALEERRIIEARTNLG